MAATPLTREERYRFAAWLTEQAEKDEAQVAKLMVSGLADTAAHFREQSLIKCQVAMFLLSVKD